MKLKINKVAGYTGTIEIETDSEGTPKLLFWRRRLEDSKIDGCVEVIKAAPSKSKKGD